MKLTRATDLHIDFFSILRFYIVTEKLLLSAYVENFADFSHPTSYQKVAVAVYLSKKSHCLCVTSSNDSLKCRVAHATTTPYPGSEMV